MSQKGYTKEWDIVLNNLLMDPNFPQWNKNEEHWEDTELRPMQSYVKTLGGDELPRKWVWKKILGPFGIDQRDLSSDQIGIFFRDIGFSIGSYGR